VKPTPKANEVESKSYKELLAQLDDSSQGSRIIKTFDFHHLRALLADTLPENSPILQRPEMAALRDCIKNGRELDWGVLGPLLEIKHDRDYTPPKNEHGTHVAGILAAGAEHNSGDDVMVGMCPDLRLYDLRVFGDSGNGTEFEIMSALQFIRYLNAHKDVMVLQGANLSFSIRHDVANYACGRTPVCEECERLVSSGVVVVTAAGNDGYLEYMTSKGLKEGFRNISITDPGNADGVITVGSTHSFQPHTYGVSYFSSRGPTGDGRMKPDLVAPGEKICSTVLNGGYKTMDGTSMAAPHVSGAAALLIARHPELVGQPRRIKEILCRSATDLGRERYFQGAGLLDVLRALQSV
jgi:subtilisin family serine protease